jgi:hypothetical protein
VKFAAAYEDPPAVWGVGRLVVGGTVTPWPVSQADVDDEAESQLPRLAALGVGAGDLVLILSMLSEAVHVVPLEKAAGVAPRRWVKLGPTSAWEEQPGRLVYDATRWDASDGPDGEVLLTNRVERLTSCERLPTGVRGEVREPGSIRLSTP